MVHRIVFRVASEEALDFWEQRVGGERGEGRLRFEDPEGLGLELVVSSVPDQPLTADHPDVPAAVALQGFDSVHVYTDDPEASRAFLEAALDFREVAPDVFECRGEERGGLYAYELTTEPGVGGAGTVHHVAWASPMDEHETWRQRVLDAGGRPTP